MAFQVCPSCGGVVGDHDGEQDVNGSLCKACQKDQDKIDALRQECEEYNANQRRLNEAGGWCGFLALAMLAIFAAAVAVLL